MGVLKFRLRWYSVPSLIPLLATVGCAVLPFVVRSQGRVWALVLGVFFLAGWVLTMYLDAIEVTPADVRGYERSSRRTVVPREVIHAMHWNSNYITLVDSGHGVLLRIPSYGWAGSQLLGVSEAIGVPLYDHRTKRGFGKNVRVGKLVTDRRAKTK